MPEHLTTTQITSFRRGELPFPEWQLAFEHTKACVLCQEAVYPAADEEAVVNDLLSKLESVAGPATHLSFEELWAFSTRDYKGVDRAGIRKHLETCEECRWNANEIAEQRSVSPGTLIGKSSPRRLRRWQIVMPAIAGVLGLAVVALFIWRSNPAQISRESQTASALTESFSAEDQRIVQAALSEGAVEIPKEVRVLRGSRSVLLGSSEKAALPNLLRPIGTAVSSQTPRFEWAGIADEQYQVRIFQNYEKVAVSPWLTKTGWSPLKLLPRSKVYTWQLAFRRQGKEIFVPAPPEPEARFLVCSKKDADAAAQLESQATVSPISTAILFAHLGLIDEAIPILDLWLSQHPQNATSIRSIRDILASGATR